MNSLRNRIATLLILAIVTVVGLPAFAASRALQPPLPEATIEPVARQIHLLIAFVKHSRAEAIAAGIRLESAPLAGTEEERLSRYFMRSLEKTGALATVIVTENSGNSVFLASVQLDDNNWLISEVPDFTPPPGRWLVLAGWIALIVFGSMITSMFAASKATRPLRIIESAVSQIGPEGMLTHIPETGSGEVRATAQALNRLSARLKSAIESRTRLVAAAGHDLRTPMTRMRLRAEFIPDNEEPRKWLSDLEELDIIAESAICLVREEASRDGNEVMKLDEIVHEIVDELQQLGYKVIQLSTAMVSIVAGPIALKRALRNLIINAATDGGGATVRIACEDQRTATLTIRMKGQASPRT